MQQNKIEILSTAPLDNALVNSAAQNDVIIDVLPFIKIEKIINAEIKKKITNLLQQKITAVFTSVNAVDSVKSYVLATPAWKIYCTGNTTKKLIVQVFGKESIAGFANNGNQLSKVILKDNTLKKIFFFCGNKHLDTIPVDVKNNGVAVEEITVYKTIETSAIIKKQYHGILFYSPSAVQSFFKNNTISDITELFAIGSTTAKAIKQFSGNHVNVAGIPGKEDLVNLAINYFSKRQIL